MIVDTSDSLSDGDYLQVKKFIKEMGEIFHVSPHASHVSVVQAGDNVQVAIDFKSSKFGRKKFQQNVDAMKNLGGSWSLDRAFGVVKQKIFSREGGVRNFIPHVAIVITNRRQKRVTHSALVEAAKELHDSRVTVYAIGVGGDTSPDELRSMVKEEYQVYQVNTFKDLANLSSNFSRDICVVHSGNKLSVKKE